MAKPAGTEANILPLPKGGGAQRAIDETFQTNLSTGSGYYEIQIKLPRGINDLTPTLGLKYSSGAGNGPFGLGWGVNIPSIIRRTERGMPSFSDDGVAGDDRDTLFFEGLAIVPDGGGFYRPRVETEPLRFRRMEADNSWEMRTDKGLCMRFGVGDAACSGEGAKVLEWHLSEIRDTNDNVITFAYTKHGRRACLASVSYAIYRVDLQYEERPDPFSSFRGGIELRMERRCRAIELTLLQPAPTLVKSYRLLYTPAPYSQLSLLTKVQLVALQQPVEGGPTTEIPLPPVILEYTGFDPDARRLEVFDSVGGSPPPSLLQPDTTLLDFEGTGLPGVVEIRNGTARFWRNNPRLRWSPPRTMRDLPLNADLRDNALRFVDMEGNGTADLLVGTQQAGGYFPNTPGGGWGRKVHYRQSPNTSLANPRVRLLDLDGDNRVDMMLSDSNAFYHYLNRGTAGWAPQPLVVKREHALEEWPDVDLANANVRFADIVGDGRSHLVLIHDGRVVYYPNLGLGQWGAMRRMTNAPRLPRNYDPARLFLADVDGDGTADVIYVDFDCIYLWLNQAGNGFSDPIVVHGTPPIANAAIVIADMKGTGTQGVLWSYEGALHHSQNYRYLDLAGGTKPLLLKRITNNRGVTTTITYGSSTDWPRVTDDPDLNAHPFLPFPVLVVRQTEMHDPSTGVTSASRFGYWNGNYDGHERVFLGFGRAERTDLGDASVPANRTVTYFHNDSVLLKGSPRLARGYGDDATPMSSRPFVEEINEYQTLMVHTTPAGVEIERVARSATVTRTFEREEQFSEVRTEYQYDGAGNLTLQRERARWTDDQGSAHEEVLLTEKQYAVNAAAGLGGFLAREVSKDQAGQVLRGRTLYYDGPEFVGLAEGQVQKGNLTRERQFAMPHAQLLTVFGAGVSELAMLGYVRVIDPDLGDAYFVDRLAQKTDARGNPVERRDALGNATKITYDAFGIYPTHIEHANGLPQRAEYEYAYGSMTHFTNSRGVTQRFRFDAAGRLTGVFRFDDPDGQPYLEYQYVDDAPVQHQVTLTRSEPGAVQHRRVEYFDGLGQSLQVRSDAEDSKVVVSGRKDYNAKGLLFREHQAYFSTGFAFSLADQQPAEHFTEYHYDARGRSTVRLDWQGQLYESRYSCGVRRHFDPLDLKNTPGNANFNTPQTEWRDARERLVAVFETKQAETYITRSAYDLLGNRTEVRVDGSLLLQNTFDALGRRIRSSYRDAGTYTLLYDAAGNLVQRTDGKGDVVFRKYDMLNRLTEVRYGGPAGALQEACTYDVGAPGEQHTEGNLTRVTGPFGEVRYTYGVCGCLQSKTRVFPGLAGALTVRYETDSLRRYTKIVYPDGFELAIAYNRGGFIDSIPGIVDNASYGPTGKRTRLAYSSGVVTDYTFDPVSLRLGRVKTIAPDGATTYQDLTYGYDEVGGVISVVDAANAPGHVKNSRTFTYDELQQLLISTGAAADGPYSHSYAYDHWGNITRYPEQLGDELLYENPSRPFRITGIENQKASPYRYDDAGNLTLSLHSTFVYDARNRLVKVTQDDGTEIVYLYDHQGSRVVSRITSGGATESTFNFDDIYVVSGAEVTKLIFDEFSQLAMIRADGSGVVFHKDHLGSHALESDLATGALLSEETYYAFGKRTLGVAFAAPYGYAGKKFDAASGLVAFGGRYYLPEIGRFLTPDPSFLEQQPDRFFNAPRSLQLYTYVLNNPMNMIDPSGLFFWFIPAVLGAGAGAAAAAGAGAVAGAGAYMTNWAVSGGDFQLSEFFASSLMGAVNVWAAYSTLGVDAAIFVGAAMLARPAVSGALDKASMGDSAGERMLGFLSFAIKFGSSPASSTIGLLIGGFGTGFGLYGDVKWFKGGVIAFKYDPENKNTFAALTLGGTVNIWHGNTNHASFAHELYHSRQYTYFGDAFVPAWILGGAYGLISSAIAGETEWSCFVMAHPDSNYGNALEAHADDIAPGSGCS